MEEGSSVSSPQAAFAHLPERPSLEHLRRQARRRLRALREQSAAARLTEAQLLVAREYGFASWRDLKVFVERRNGPAEPYRNLIGFYRHDPRLTTNGVVEIGSAAGGLFIERGGSRFGLSDRGQGRLAVSGVEGHYTFEGSEDGPATALVSHSPNGEVRLERIEAAEARAILGARDRAKAEQAAPRTPIVVSPALLQRYAGHYASGLGLALEVVHRDGALLAQVAGQPRMEVLPESETRFFYRVMPAQLSFEMDDGRVVAAILHQGGLLQRLERVSADVTERAAARTRDKLAEPERPRTLVAIDPGILPRYAGRYRMDAASMLVVSTEGGRLFVDIAGQRRYEVHPESEQTFFWTVVAAQISFVTDAAGQVTHAVLHQHGLDIPLTRLGDDGDAA
jgi:hypothetical protein